MAQYLINGGRRLMGETEIGGAKNSVLPILAASVLCGGEVIIHRCPDLSDVRNSLEILDSLSICGGRLQDHTLILPPAAGCKTRIDDALMRKMRSSVVFTGGILGRCGEAELTYPGGCELGSRPVNYHFAGLRRLGAEVIEEGGRILCRAPRGLRGTSLFLPFPSVGATETLMIAACCAKGESVIYNAAREPEIVDLADFLNRCGAGIRGAGSGEVVIAGDRKLGGCEFTLMPDRIAAATVLTAVAACGGAVLVREARRRDSEAVLAALEAAGARLSADDSGIYLTANRRPKALGSLTTAPFPGFPTDAQPLLTVLMTLANGATAIHEAIFDNRFGYADQLTGMGVGIRVFGRTALVEGTSALTGARLRAADLRGGAALIVAALAAQGESIVENSLPLERGYEHIERQFAALGADIRRQEFEGES